MHKTPQSPLHSAVPAEGGSGASPAPSGGSAGGFAAGQQVFMPPLIGSLAGLLQRKGSPVGFRQLASHMPGGFGAPTVEECLLATERAGVFARMVNVPSLADIPLPTLPCVLVLGETQSGAHASCILLGVDTPSAQDGGDTPPPLARVVFPETDPETVPMPLAELEALYSGFAIFVPRPENRADPRTENLVLATPRHWFWGVLREFAPVYRDVAVASFMVNLLSLAGPLFIMNVYDRVVPNNAVYTLWVLAAGVMLAYVVDFALRNVRSYFVDTAGRGADVIIASRLVDRVLHMRLDAKPESVGGLVNNMREFEQVRDFFGSTSLLALFDVPFLLLFILVVAFIGGPMVFLLLAALPLMLLFVWLVQAPFQRSVERQFKQNMHKNSLLVEMVSGLETVKSILAQGHLKHRWEGVVDAAAAESARSRRLASLAHTGTLFITFVLNAGVIVMGVYRISDGMMTQGGLIACVILVGRALGPFMQLAAMLTNMQKARVALAALDHIVNLPLEESAGARSGTRGLSPELALEGVRFRYPGASGDVLRDVTLRIKPGEKVGVVGATGSGKSTLGRLCIGLYTPQEGAVTFGGVDIRQLDPAELRSRVAYMPQDNFLFYGTVRENIALGSPWMDMKTLTLAAEAAGVAAFVAKHPAGYDMQVGERGMNLSVGQRQSVALARTLARFPEVFVLDEPSSNLDMHGEHRLMLRLQPLVKDKTLIIISHRPSLLALAERVVVMQDGVIVADGPRDAVLRALNRGELQTAHRRGAGA